MDVKTGCLGDRHQLMDIKYPEGVLREGSLGEQCVAVLLNYKFLPKRLLGRQWQTTQYNPYSGICFGGSTDALDDRVRALVLPKQFLGKGCTW